MEPGSVFQYISALFPARITKASKGFGSFLNIYFSVDESREGHIWIYLCHWKLFHGEDLVESSGSITAEEKIIRFFSGENLLSLDVSGLEVSITISQGKRLVMCADQTEYGNEDILIIYTPGRPPIGYGPRPGCPRDYGWNLDED
jgi:hypothetical protein